MRSFSDYPTKQAIFLATLHFLSRLRSFLALRGAFTAASTFHPTHPTENASRFSKFHKMLYTGVQYLPNQVYRDSRKFAFQPRSAAFLVDLVIAVPQHLVPVLACCTSSGNRPIRQH